MHHQIFSLLIFVSLSVNAMAGDAIDFARDIEPIFETNCRHCHGEDEQEGGLRVDRRASLLKGGDHGIAAIVPGDPARSFLLEVIEHRDADLKMPPDEDKLSADAIELISRWIGTGAHWPGQMGELEGDKSDHWSFQPVSRPKTPASIDAFLHRKLDEHGLAFSPAADPLTLIRRVSIVLTGLPPTPSEVASFIRAYEDDAEVAYARLVDRLLASPHFGERRAQHWLDVIRWSETNGSEGNLYRKNAWRYRDYVIAAFNADKPYDQFIREQIAGDTLQSGVATGFLVAGPHVPAATVGRMIYQERMRRVDDQMFTAFDFPDCGQIRDKRPVSTTPLQALNLMNSDFVVEQAALIADRAEQESVGGASAAISRCYQLLLQREPSAEELAACERVADTSGLAIVCRVLLNSNEFAFLP